MSKRSRGGGRPGQRRPNPRTSGRPAVARPGIAPSAAVERPLAPVVDAAVDGTAIGAGFGADEAAAPRPTRRSRQASNSFTDAATQEYAYVISDVRRIGLVGGSLFAVMIVLFILLEVVHAITI